MKEKFTKEYIEEAAIKASNFRQKQSLPYAAKVAYARKIAWGFYDHSDINGSCYVAVGGLDSITLLTFLRSIGIDVPAVSVSSLEDKSIQRIHKELGVIELKPLMPKVKIIREYGFPVISKEKAAKISALQNPTEKNATIRHAIITGETGVYGGNRKESKMRLPQKWLELFGGYENEREGTNYGIPDFKVSEKCCYYLKEKPCDDYRKETGRYPYMGLMASEGGRREKALAIHGCNYVTPTTKRSCPFAIFSRQDLLQLALDLHVPVPEIYGEIVRDEDGTLRTTGAQRTGCSMCGFGVHIEKRPHRFDQLYARNPKERDFWMNKVCTDEKTGESYGWGRVLSYIGVEWEHPEMWLGGIKV